MAKKPAWSGDWPIPKRIDLPGCRVTVRQTSAQELKERGYPHGCWIYDVEEGLAKILLNKEDPIEVQRWTLWHELDHVVVESRDIMLEFFMEHVHPFSISNVIERIEDDTDAGGSGAPEAPAN